MRAFADPELTPTRIHHDSVRGDQSIDGVAVAERQRTAVGALSIAQERDGVGDTGRLALRALQEGIGSLPPLPRGRFFQHSQILWIGSERPFEMIGDSSPAP